MRSLWINGYGQPGAMQDPTVPTIPQPQYPQPPVQQPGAWAQNTPAPQQQWQPPAALQQWEPAQQQPVQAVPQQPMAAQIMPQEREERILREAAAGVAVQLLRHLHVEEQNFANLIRLSERLVHYYKNGVPPGWTGENPGGAGISGDPGPDGQPHSDDDIPF